MNILREIIKLYLDRLIQQRIYYFWKCVNIKDRQTNLKIVYKKI